MPMGPSESSLLSMADIAKLAGVKRPVVSTWRRRYADFPAPAAQSDTRPMFDGADMLRWLADRGLGNTPPDRLREDLTLHTIIAYAAEFGPYDFVELTGSLLCLRHFGQRALPGAWEDLLRRAERLDGEDEFLLRELRAADPSAIRLRRLVEDLIEAAYTPGGAHEWLLSEPARLGVTDLTEALLASEIARMVADIADLPSRLATKGRVTLADPYGCAGDLLLSLIARTDERDRLTVLAADRRVRLARLTRRRLLLAGVDEINLDVRAGVDLEERMADPDLVITRLPYEPGETRSVLGALTALDRIGLQLTSGATAVVIGPADALIDSLEGTAEAQLRSELLRSGLVEAAVALPGGSMPYRPGYRAGMWVMTRDPVKAARGRILLSDTRAEPVAEDVCARLAEDVLLWRAEGHHRDAHDPRYGRAVRIADLDADFGGPLISSGWSAARLRSDDVDDRPARISQAVVRLSQAVQRAHGQGKDLGEFSPQVVRRVDPAPASITIGELIAEGRVRSMKGHRIRHEHIERDGHHTVIGAEEIIGESLLGARRIDRLLFAAEYEYGRLTGPGDIVYTRSPRFGVHVDDEGYNVVAFPARVLRVAPEADRPLRPRVLAALLIEASRTARGAGAVHPAAIEELTIPDLATEEVERLDGLLAELDVRERLLRDQLDELAEIRRLTFAGLADGTLTINDRDAESRLNRTQ